MRTSLPSHFLSNRGRRLLAGLALALAAWSPPTRLEAQTMTVGAPERIYTNYSTNTTSDVSCPVLKDPDNPSEVFSWTSNGKYAFAKFRGPLHDPNRTQIWSGYAGRWDFTGYPSGYRPWLGNIYKHTDGTLIGFVHIETAAFDDPNCEYRQGIAISTDNGDHWKYCGDVIKPALETTGQQNLGGCAVIKVGDYFYQYFNEYETGFFRKPAVARALIADVVAAAKNNTVSPWVKYYNGQWNHNALTEAGSSVLPYPTDRHDAHGDAVYCAPLGKYLMVVYEQQGNNYASPGSPPSDALKGTYMYSSTDGVTWGEKKHIFVPQAGGDGCYSFFGGITGASDDNLEVGSEFYVYVNDRARHELYRVPITVDNGQIHAPAFSPPAGSYTGTKAVTISSTTPGATIRYTLDGSPPTASNGITYTGPVNIEASATLKAYATRNDLGDSEVTSAAYVITLALPTNGIVNGSFENGTAGWTIASSNSSAAAYSVGAGQGAADQSNALALGSGNAAGNAIFSQTVLTTPGTSYTLTFKYGGFGLSNKQQKLLLEVLDGSAPLASQVLAANGQGNFTPSQTTFQLKTYNFVAPSSSVVVRFTDQTTLANSDGCDGMLDAVVLTGYPPASFTHWRSALWPGVSDQAVVGEDADPDGDGKSNLFEYALGLNPKTSDALHSVVIDSSGDRLTLSFRRQARAELTYLVQGSFNLLDWDLIWQSSGAANAEGWVTVEDSEILAQTGKRFLRLKVLQ